MKTAAVILGILAVASSFSGCTPAQITGSGNIASHSYDFTGFTGVRICSGFTAEIKASSIYSIKLTADDNLFDYVNVREEGDILSVELKPGSYNQTHLQAIILMPSLQAIEVSDGSFAESTGFNSTEDLSIRLSDGSMLSGTLTAGNTSIILTDGSRLTLDGAARDVTITSSDGSWSDLQDFTAANADLSIGDGGISLINVDGTLNADLSAGARVIYRGTPKLGGINLSDGATIINSQ